MTPLPLWATWSIDYRLTSITNYRLIYSFYFGATCWIWEYKVTGFWISAVPTCAWSLPFLLLRMRWKTLIFWWILIWNFDDNNEKQLSRNKTPNKKKSGILGVWTLRGCRISVQSTSAHVRWIRSTKVKICLRTQRQAAAPLSLWTVTTTADLKKIQPCLLSSTGDNPWYTIWNCNWLCKNKDLDFGVV